MRLSPLMLRRAGSRHDIAIPSALWIFWVIEGTAANQNSVLGLIDQSEARLSPFPLEARCSYRAIVTQSTYILVQRVWTLLRSKPKYYKVHTTQHPAAEIGSLSTQFPTIISKQFFEQMLKWVIFYESILGIWSCNLSVQPEGLRWRQNIFTQNCPNIIITSHHH